MAIDGRVVLSITLYLLLTGDFSSPKTAADMKRGDIGKLNHQSLSTKVSYPRSQCFI